MRLMCPNCDAEYEVDPSAIPESGRDVQCSNCGHAWFQHHPELEADNDAEAALYDPPPPLSKTARPETVLPSDLDWQVESDDPEAILDAMGREARESGADAPEPTASDRTKFENIGPETEALDDSAPVPKHDIDSEALRILREEAELETAQRAMEQGLVAQTPPVTGGPVVARRVARLKGIQPPAANPTANIAPTNAAPPNAVPVPSSDRLPKIDAVSLRDDDLLPAVDDPKPKTGRGGIVTIFFIALLAVAAYVLSPDLAVLLPSLAKPLAQYVAFVDGLRDQLDVLLPKIIAALNGILSQALALGERLMVLVKGWF